MAQTTGWGFDPQDAVALLVGNREEKYPLEYPTTLYMLFLWALWATDMAASVTDEALSKSNWRNLRNSARCLGTVVTLSTMNREGCCPHPTERRLRGQTYLAAQLLAEWYTQFNDRFLRPADGLNAQILDPRMWPRAPRQSRRPGTRHC